jgi:hypothetical protein
MSNQDRSNAAEVIRQNLTLIDRASAYWYACGYNDNRKVDDPYVDPFKFAEQWLIENAKPSHPSLQDVFKAFERQAFLDRLCGREPAQSVASQVMSDLIGRTTVTPTQALCRHCDRMIVLDGDRWVDPMATGDDSVWRETCDSHDTFTAEHEPGGE